MVLRQGHNEKGRCDSCGFLSKRLFIEKRLSIELQPPECYEATLYDRDFGTLYVRANSILQQPFIPWCFLGVANLRKEVEDLFESQDAENVCVVTVITKDRQCPRWYPWREFLSPREHFEEYQMLESERKRQEFEQRMEKGRKEFESKLDERNRKDRNRTDWIMIGLAIAATLLAGVELYATLTR